MNTSSVRRLFLLCLMSPSLMIAPTVNAQRVVIEPRPIDAARVMARLVSVQLDAVSLATAIKAIVHSASVRVQYPVATIAAAEHPVSLYAVNMPLGTALDRVLSGTGLRVTVLDQDLIGIKAELDGAVTSLGRIQGTVTDVATRRGLPGAAVVLDDAARGVTSADNGAFEIRDIPPGTHRLTIRRIGYVKQIRTITVTNDEVTTVNVALEPSTNTLDQVVVTGTVVQTELKAVPNAITVITAKQIEERGIIHIDQLFRGDIPGLFALHEGSGATAILDEVTMFSRGATALSNASGGTSDVLGNARYTNPIKTYVDGVELADPKYLSQIDPKSIERIEILTGPQASTIYGSNAINGVMQIFTKRGATFHPQLSLNLLSGWVENNFSSARTPQHDYSAQLNGIEGRLSYSAGGSWNYVGPWSPGKQVTRTSGFGGARLDLPTTVGQMKIDVTLRNSITQTLQHGSGVQSVAWYQEIGWYLPNRVVNNVDRRTTYTLTGQTLGLTFSYQPITWWSHEIGLGQDVSEVENRNTVPGYASRSDTTLFLSQSQNRRDALRYATTLQIPVTTFVTTTLVAGADAWRTLNSSWQVSPQVLTGSLTGSTSAFRRPGHNTGGFFQGQLGLQDRLFLTYGLRAEWNPDYGDNAQPNYAPRYGVAYAQEFGPMTTKLRMSYGHSTRPPQPTLKSAQTIAEFFGPADWALNASSFLPYYGNIFDLSLASPELGPEYQRGGEGGVELYWGNVGSLVVTRYNQTVDGLIDQAIVDSVRSVLPCPIAVCSATSLDSDGYGYYPQFQYLNVGSIRNQGWELQGTTYVGPLSIRGVYSWTKSRTIGVTPKFRQYFASRSSQYQPGATFMFLPEHTWSLGMTYNRTTSSIGLNLNGTGELRIVENAFSLERLSTNVRLPQNRFAMSSRGYTSLNQPYIMADLTAAHRFSPGVEGVLQVQNLTDYYRNDFSPQLASLGRQLKMGCRVRSL